MAESYNLTVLRWTQGPTSAGEYVAPLENFIDALSWSGDTSGCWLPSSDWWDEPAIRDSNKVTFNRKQIVLALANKEGGAHVDASTTEAYAAVLKSASLSWTIRHAAGDQSVRGNPIFASVRQIAWEVERSLLTRARELVGDSIWTPASPEHLERTNGPAPTVFIGGTSFVQGELPAPRPVLGRNDPCYCDSGLKFKRCHGRNPALKRWDDRPPT